MLQIERLQITLLFFTLFLLACHFLQPFVPTRRINIRILTTDGYEHTSKLFVKRIVLIILFFVLMLYCSKERKEKMEIFF
jgi:hypothetical protein